MSASFEYYKIFYYVAKYHSFNKAAMVLSNSQPNISRSISNLEAELGCKLFNRSSRGVTLTDAGEALFPHAEAAFKHIETGEELLHSATELKYGILTIGFSIGLTQKVVQTFILPTLRAFHDTYPDVKLKIIHSSTPDLLSKISDNLMDAAFITSSYKDNRDGESFQKTIIHSYQDIVIAGTHYSELADRKIPLSEIMNYPLISLNSETETFKYYHDFCAEYGFEFKPSIETTSVGQTLIYTKENLGISCIHPKDAEQAIKNKQIFQINLKEKLPKRYIAMILGLREKRAAGVFEKMLHDNLTNQV